jgi:regulator of cell morphogenesis and NO signaling
MSTILHEVAVGILVAERPSRSRVFEKYGIDFCCGGKMSLAQAASEAGVDVRTLLDALRASDEEHAQNDTNWLEVPLVDLCANIVGTHHTYLKTELPRLEGLTAKIARVHGDNHAELVEVADLFAALREELEQHMLKEERVLFPIVEQLVAAKTRPAFHCGSVQNPISMMELEHDNAAAALERLRNLTNGYTTPQDGCNTYRATMDGLARFENDMHHHIHKENSVLFPRAVALEASLPLGR